MTYKQLVAAAKKVKRECVTYGSPVKDFYDVEDLCLELAVAFLDLHESRRNKYGESL
jgi:hypothetical protein